MGDSGHFVLARWTQEDKTEIEMTAFKVSMMTMTAGKMVLQWFFGLCLFTKLSHNQFGYIWIWVQTYQVNRTNRTNCTKAIFWCSQVLCEKRKASVNI